MVPGHTFSKHSNKKIIKNAIEFVCLAGEVNRKLRQKVLSVIDKSEENYFVIVFKTELLGSRVFKALFSHNVDSGEVKRVLGANSLPSVVKAKMVKSFYSYDSGAKKFKELPCKDFILGTDAIVLKLKHSL